jgi:uncharacterized protein
MIFSTYNHFVQKENKNFLYNALSNSLIEVGPDLFYKLKQELNGQVAVNNDVINKNPVLKELLIFTTPEQEAFVLNNIHLKNLMHRFDMSYMSLTVAPTSYCNFSCIYCYEDFRPKIFMSDETEVKLLEFIEQRNPKRLDITWFGGEPLLNFKRIKSITKKIQQNKVNYEASIITNGYLLNTNVINSLAELNVRFMQITIDGVEETHNKRRPHISRPDSFRKIIRNLDSLCEKEMPILINLRINIDRNNEGEFPIIAQYLRNKYPFKNVMITPTYVSGEVGTGCQNPCLFNREEKAKFKLSHFEVDTINYYPNFQNLDCMARQINSYLINADGGIYKCYNDIGNKEKEIGNLHLKGINAELLTTYLMKEDSYNNQNCLKCNISPICNGGCPHVRIFGKDSEEKNESCHLMKGFETDFLQAHILHKTKHESNLIR